MEHNLSTIYPQPNGDGGFKNGEVAKTEKQVVDNDGVLSQKYFTPITANDLVSNSDLLSRDELQNAANQKPIAVVNTLSTRGLEYVFMSISLWFGAAGLIWTLLLLVNGRTSAIALAFPVTSLFVCAPVFAGFFLRLKKAELNDPLLRFEPSKRRLSQITQIAAFIIMLINIITFVYLIISSATGSVKISVVKAFLNLLVVTAVAGGILVYYWIDEHRPLSR